jgi:uncharacterized protein (TIGR03382 family)
VRTAFTGSAPRQASVTFTISGGSPAPAPRDASTTVLASRASGCSSTGDGPGGAIALLVAGAWLGRRRFTRAARGESKLVGE